MVGDCGSFLAIYQGTPAELSAHHSIGLGAMTRNRTALDMLTTLGTQLTVILLFVLAAGLAVGQYLSAGRERMRRVELKIRKRASRRGAAA
jgi:hypothetical protein